MYESVALEFQNHHLIYQYGKNIDKSNELCNDVKMYLYKVNCKKQDGHCHFMVKYILLKVI